MAQLANLSSIRWCAWCFQVHFIIKLKSCSWRYISENLAGIGMEHGRQSMGGARYAWLVWHVWGRLHPPWTSPLRIVEKIHKGLCTNINVHSMKCCKYVTNTHLWRLPYLLYPPSWDWLAGIEILLPIAFEDDWSVLTWLTQHQLEKNNEHNN